MSRIGKQPIVVPPQTTMEFLDQTVKVTGPKGALSLVLQRTVKMRTNDDQSYQLYINNEDDKKQQALWGLYRRLIVNMITGVNSGFEKKLEMVGVGFKAASKGDTLVLNVGFSHPVEYHLPLGITAQVVNNTQIHLQGIDKQLVGEVAAQIRKIRKPEPYKGKGIRYAGEIVRRKSGKSTKSA